MNSRFYYNSFEVETENGKVKKLIINGVEADEAKKKEYESYLESRQKVLDDYYAEYEKFFNDYDSLLNKWKDLYNNTNKKLEEIKLPKLLS